MQCIYPLQDGCVSERARKAPRLLYVDRSSGGSFLFLYPIAILPREKRERLLLLLLFRGAMPRALVDAERERVESRREL